MNDSVSAFESIAFCFNVTTDSHSCENWKTKLVWIRNERPETVDDLQMHGCNESFLNERTHIEQINSYTNQFVTIQFKFASIFFLIHWNLNCCNKPYVCRDVSWNFRQWSCFNARAEKKITPEHTGFYPSTTLSPFRANNSSIVFRFISENPEIKHLRNGIRYVLVVWLFNDHITFSYILSICCYLCDVNASVYVCVFVQTIIDWRDLEQK